MFFHEDPNPIYGLSMRVTIVALELSTWILTATSAVEEIRKTSRKKLASDVAGLIESSAQIEDQLAGVTLNEQTKATLELLNSTIERCRELLNLLQETEAEPEQLTEPQS